MVFGNLLNLILKSFISINGKIPIISNFKEVENLFKLKVSRKYEYSYLNKQNIHRILYETENYIKIQSNVPEKNLVNLFYLILLIKYQPFVVNYIYEFNFIQNINNFRKESQNFLTIFILSMIIMELIKNYKSCDEFYDESCENQLEAIYEENKIIRNDYLANNDNFDLKNQEIESNNLEEIYSKIIISLIRKERIKNYEYTKNILVQLNIDEINITENMFKELLIVFNSNENFIKNYMISKIEDLYDEEKINFYITLLKFIFKNSIYIYNIPFLLKTRNAILKIIKFELSKLSEINKNNKNNNKNKIEYILKIFCDSNYYFKKYIGSKYEQLKEIAEYYKNFLFESKKEEIKKLNEFLINLNIEIEYENFFEDFETAQNMNERGPIIKFLIEEKQKNNICEKDVNECSKKWEYLENSIKDKKIKKNDIIILQKCFNKNKELFNKIFNQDILDYFINQIDENKNEEINEIYNPLSLELDKKIPVDKKDEQNNTTKERDKDIVLNAEIDDTYLKQNNENKNNVSKSSISYNSKYIEQGINYKESDLAFFTHINTIGNHKKSAECIKETSNGNFISGVGDKKIILYNSDFRKISEIDTGYLVTSIEEKKNLVITEVNKDEINLIVCSEDNLSLLTINALNDKIKKTQEPNNFGSSLCIEIKKNNHLFCGQKGAYIVYDLFSKIISTKSSLIIEGVYKGGIKIKDNLMAITSNDILKGGNNSIKFYNSNCQKVIKEIRGYSFTLSLNGLALIPGYISDKNKINQTILLCACKKYKKNQKNGILLVNANIEENNEIKKNFYDTGSFEVYCFCPILRKEKNSYEKLLNSQEKLFKSDYFMAGGYNKKKGMGMIKLFKINKNENIEKTTIEFVQDIEIEKDNKFNGFKGPVSCIVQSKKNGKVLVSCLDGKIHSFTAPNVNILIEFEENNYDWIKEINEKESDHSDNSSFECEA